MEKWKRSKRKEGKKRDTKHTVTADRQYLFRSAFIRKVLVHAHLVLGIKSG